MNSEISRTNLGAETFLLTGAYGFIGAWIVKRLLTIGARVVIFDLAEDAHRLRLIMDDEEIARTTLVKGDITDPNALPAVVEKFRVNPHRAQRARYARSLQRPDRGGAFHHANGQAASIRPISFNRRHGTAKRGTASETCWVTTGYGKSSGT